MLFSSVWPPVFSVLQFSKMYFIPHVRGQDEEAGLINFYRDLINFQYSSQAFYPFFLLWQDNLRLFFITCKSHQLSGDNSWKTQQHHFCAKPNLFPEGLNIFFGRSAVAIVHFYSLLSCPSSLPFGRLSNIIKLILVIKHCTFSFVYPLLKNKVASGH